MTETDVLTAIDDALDIGMPTEADPVARELQELALVLRADSPEPTDAYSEWLDRRVEQGFPQRPGAKGPWWHGLMQPAAAVAMVGVAVLLVAALAGGLSGSSTDDGASGGGIESAGGGGGVDSGGGADAGGGADERAKSAPADVGPRPAMAGDGTAALARSGRVTDRASSGAGAVTVIPPSRRGFVPGRPDRKIERTFALELAMPVDQMQRVADQVTAVTNRHGGFVLSSSVATGEDSSGGDFNLRIPVTELRPALRDLAALADVRSQSQTGRDVTPAFVTARDRLQAARAERKSLLRRLEAATTDTEAEAIRVRLDIVAGQINALRSRLRGLRLRTDYAVVTVSLQAKDGDEGGGGAGSFDDAVNDAGDILVGIAGVLLRVLAGALPFALIALLGWLAARALQRRRRESALI
ncbi:MAG TPA: DUF4349 domain-containing protein [Thermoleophilaceae bacterium]|nr:DUF4349 domain-containing protein [Thermoleophilaceae bacterium]